MTIYTHDGSLGAEAYGTWEWFRASLEPIWADWHRDADTDMTLDEYIEQSLDESLIELSAEQAATMRVLETGEAVPA